MSLADFLKEELVDDTVFTIPVGKGIGISESTAVSWVVMAVIILLCIILGSNLKVDHISKRQAAAEFIVTKLESTVGNIVGEGGKAYVPYLVTVLLYLGFANIIGVFGFKPPTKSLIVTGALAVMSIILVEAAGIRATGPGGWLHSFIEPMPIVAPFNILDVFTRPLSLCMRLFGNVLGAFVIMEILDHVTKAVIPAVASLYFDFFDGLLQAYVFVCLTGMYIKEATEVAER